MTEASLIEYIIEHKRCYPDEERITLADAWDDFADAYGWDLEENPYR